LKYLPVKVMATNEASDQGTIRAPMAPGAILVGCLLQAAGILLLLQVDAHSPLALLILAFTLMGGYLPVKVMATNEASDQGTIRAPMAPGAIPVTRCRDRGLW
jgi:hypothetical protein